MRKALFAPLLAALAFAAPGSAGTTATLKGVVIARMPAQGQLVVAGPAGRTTTLRAPSLPALGTVVRASAFRLSDGTSATGRLRTVGHVHRAHFRGVLVRTVGSTSFYAAGHSVVAVHIAARSVASARSLSSAGILSPGEAAEIEVTIEAGRALSQTSVTPTPSDEANEVTLQVTITAVTPATATTPGSLTLSINGQTLVIPLPAGTVLPPTFVANASVGVKIEFKQPGVRADDDQGDDEQGDDDHHGTTTTTAGTTTAAPAAGGTTSTIVTTTSSRHQDGHGGRDGGGDGGGDD